MVQDLAIRVKALMVFLISLIIMGAVIGALGYWKLHQSLEQDAFASMSGMREVKRKQIEYYFERLRLEVQTVVQSPIVKLSAGQLIQAFAAIPQQFKLTPEQLETYKKAIVDYYKNDFIKKLNAQVLEDHSYEQYLPATDTALILQFLYIVSNPNPVGSKGFLNQATDGSFYSMLHGKFQNILRDIVTRFGFYDMYLIDPASGAVVYSANKEVDFATSLKIGPYRNSDLAWVYEQCAASTNKDLIIFSDFKPYDPAYGAAVAFIGASIYDQDKKEAIVVFQLNNKDINAFMTNDNQWDKLGLGQTGEIYLVGQDYKMRSISRMFLENIKDYLSILERQGVAKKIIDQMRINQTTVLLQEVSTPPVKELFRGQIATAYDNNYLGIPVLSSFSQLSIPGLSWGIIVEKQQQEIFDPARKFALIAGIIFALLALLIFFTLFSMMKIVLMPLAVLTLRMQQLSGEIAFNKLQSIHVRNDDEVGKLVQFYNATLARLSMLFKKINYVYLSIGLILNEFAQSHEDATRYKNQLQERLEKIETLSQAVIQQLRVSVNYNKQIHELINNLSSSVLNVMSSFTLVATYTKRAEEVVGVVRKNVHSSETKKDTQMLSENINELNTIVINISSAIAACEQSMTTMRTYLDHAQSLHTTDLEPSEYNSSQINLIVHETNGIFRQFSDQMSHLVAISQQIKKVNDDFGKILSTLIST